MSGIQAPEALNRLQQILCAHEGVEAAFFDEERATLWIIGRGRLATDDLGTEIDSALAAAELDRDRVQIRCVAGYATDRRVRFLGIERIPEDETHSTRFRVALEWQGTVYAGDAVGERSDPIELRTAAAASLDAVSHVVGDDLSLRLTGVKEFRAFDTQLVAVSIHGAGPPIQRFVGTVMETEGPARAAALAVLAALNRILGTHLIRSE